jgi:hypothetical protein
MEARQVLEPTRAGDAICVVTDGFDNVSRISTHEAKKAFTGQDVRLVGFLVGYGTPNWTFVPEVAIPEALNTLVTISGGSMPSLFLDTGRGEYRMPPLEPKLTDEQRRAILSDARQVAERISESYQLTVTLPERLAKPQPWKLEVLNSKGKKDGGVELFYPRHFAACN